MKQPRGREKSTNNCWKKFKIRIKKHGAFQHKLDAEVFLDSNCGIHSETWGLPGKRERVLSTWWNVSCFFR